MTPEETHRVLTSATISPASDESVEDWLEKEGIDEDVFRDHLIMWRASAPENASEAMLLGVGFNLGWEAHKNSLAFTQKVSPPPDLSDSLE